MGGYFEWAQIGTRPTQPRANHFGKYVHHWLLSQADYSIRVDLVGSPVRDLQTSE